MKAFTIVFTGAIITGTAMAQEYAKGFTPELHKVLINGKTFFTAGKNNNKTIEVDSSKAVKILYIFKNIGTKVTTKKGKIFVHFYSNNKILLSSDFYPKVPTTKWTKNFKLVQSVNVNFKKAKSKTVDMMFGFYFPKANPSRLQFKGVDRKKRFAVGKIKVK